MILLQLLLIICCSLCVEALSLPGKARIRAARTTVQTVQDTDCCLEDYMHLPAAQYTCVPMPLNSSLNRLRGKSDQFKLCVPPIQLKSPGVPVVEVRPVMMATVDVQKDQVIITSNSCQIGGSKIIEDLVSAKSFLFQAPIIFNF